MPTKAAGVLLYRTIGGGTLEVLLVHMGGPLWSAKDRGAWSIPKGEYGPGEEPLAAAQREFEEELGSPLAEAEPELLGEVRQPGGKRVLVFAAPGDFDVSQLRSNLFELEWPPRSGRRQSFPEVDRAAWFPISVAAEKLVSGQAAILPLLLAHLGSPGSTAR